MSDVTRLLSDIEQGDPRAAEQLLPLVYDELRRLAARYLSRESPGQTLQPTALVNEAYLRLVTGPLGAAPHWNSRGHFFAAAAEAMRRILVEQARRKGRVRHGSEYQRVELTEDCALIEPPCHDLLAVDEALGHLELRDPERARVVKLRFFAGLSMPEIAAALNVSLATAERHWTFARAWLFAELSEPDEKSDPK